jgi:hypothetical protein
VTSTRTLPDVLANEGIADLTGLWPTETVQGWNDKLDPMFAAIDAEARSYVGADQLVNTGVFAELFSDPVRRLIAGIQPSALLYHCHCYEIAAGQDKSHIHAGKLQGWHKDWDTVQYFTPDYPSYLSLFVLLSPVAGDDGPFEFQPQSASEGLRASAQIVQLIGPAGTAAIWNRSYFHRAAPNRGNVRRRILKISIQPAGLPNDRIGLKEFRDAFANLDDPQLRALVDERRVGTTTPLPDGGDPVEARLFPSSKTNDLGPTAIAYGRIQSISRRLQSLAGVGVITE